MPFTGGKLKPVEAFGTGNEAKIKEVEKLEAELASKTEKLAEYKEREATLQSNCNVIKYSIEAAKDEGKAVKKSAGIKRGKKKKKKKKKNASDDDGGDEKRDFPTPADGAAWVVGGEGEGEGEGDGFLPDIVQFAEIASEFPNIRLKVVLEAEQHFRSVDVDGNAYIDAAELEMFFAKKKIWIQPAEAIELIRMFDGSDGDEAGSLDYMEYLEALNVLDHDGELARKLSDPTMNEVGRKVLQQVSALYKESAAKAGACVVM